MKKMLVALLIVVVAIVGAWVGIKTTDKTNEPTSSNTPTETNKGFAEYTSSKGVIIKIYEPQKGETVSSPMNVKGEVPGNWSFEASFRITLTDELNNIIATAPAQLQGDWMTESYVPFSSNLKFSAPTGAKKAIMTLQKANPSGLIENEDNVQFELNLN